ncbi:hypothetical protein [Nonomuraea dietziae]|uniref:hypothetical protein n=1 Tax=Nonomuraea dietziae TaxID=65515 RepID=UPI0031CDFBB4
MQQVSYDTGSPNTPPIGLGWVLYPFGDTTVLAMSGASPGGVSLLCVLPEHDLVLAAYGNNPGAIMLQDQILQWLLSEHLGVQIPKLVTDMEQDVDLAPYVGTYRSNQLRIDVSIVDGQLEERMTYEPADESQERDLHRVRRRHDLRPAAALRADPVRPLRARRLPAGGVRRVPAAAARLLPRRPRRPGPRFRNGGGRLTRRA